MIIAAAMFSTGTPRPAFAQGDAQKSAQGTNVQLSSITVPAFDAGKKRSWRFVTAFLVVRNRKLGERLCRYAPKIFDILYGLLSVQLLPANGKVQNLEALETKLRARINKNLNVDLVDSVHLEIGGKNPPPTLTPNGCWVLRKRT